MTRYNRLRQCGGVYFFTVVTHRRRAFLTSALARNCLKQAITATAEKRPFTMEAICVLPDHLHCIWSLPQDDSDFSLRWASIKSQFTRAFLKEGGTETTQSESRRAKRERGVWQRRFWEHAIRDDVDFRRHLDYIHFNPVKHGLANSPADWPWSTFRRFVAEGIYEPDWGSTEPFGCEAIFARAE